MSEPVNNPRFGGIVGGHLHPHAIAHRQANKTFAHFARYMRKHEMIVRERDPKHRSGQHAHDRSLQLERLFKVHKILTVEYAENAEKIS
jgi:hypothetical protein